MKAFNLLVEKCSHLELVGCTQVPKKSAFPFDSPSPQKLTPIFLVNKSDDPDSSYYAVGSWYAKNEDYEMSHFFSVNQFVEQVGLNDVTYLRNKISDRTVQPYKVVWLDDKDTFHYDFKDEAEKKLLAIKKSSIDIINEYAPQQDYSKIYDIEKLIIMRYHALLAGAINIGDKKQRKESRLESLRLRESIENQLKNVISSQLSLTKYLIEQEITGVIKPF